MSDLEQRLRTLVRIADPAGTVTVRWLAEQLGERLEEDSERNEPLGDLTVEEVADAVGRAPSTVRGWLSRGEMRGYKVNGRDWRVTRDALKAWREDQAQQDAPRPPGEVDISEWRKTG